MTQQTAVTSDRHRKDTLVGNEQGPEAVGAKAQPSPGAWPTAHAVRCVGKRGACL